MNDNEKRPLSGWAIAAISFGTSIAAGLTLAALLALLERRRAQQACTYSLPPGGEPEGWP